MAALTRRELLCGSLALAVSGLVTGCSALPRNVQPGAGGPSAPRVGWLGASAEASTANREAFKEGLRNLGYIEGQNFVVAGRFSNGHDDRFPVLAAELVEILVDVIVTAGTPAGLAAKRATSTIPIVSVSGNPVEIGLVESLVRPGGNVTGLSLSPLGGLDAKRLELLQAIVPGIARVVILGNAGNQASSLERSREAGERLGIEVLDGQIRGADDLEPTLDGAARAGAEAVMVQNDPVTSSLRTRILSLAAQKRLMLTSGERLFVEGGALMGYGVSQTDVYRRAAAFVDKILKGAKPGELPVEQPTTFEFVVNEKTATSFGLTIPELVRVQATEVIR